MRGHATPGSARHFGTGTITRPTNATIIPSQHAVCSRCVPPFSRLGARVTREPPSMRSRLCAFLCISFKLCASIWTGCAKSVPNACSTRSPSPARGPLAAPHPHGVDRSDRRPGAAAAHPPPPPIRCPGSERLAVTHLWHCPRAARAAARGRSKLPRRGGHDAPVTLGATRSNHSFFFNCPSFAAINARMSSDIARSFSHCSL